MDIFEKFIKENKDNENCRALICDSYKNSYLKSNHKALEQKTNFELATYGDALLNFTLCEILLDKVDNLSVKKQKYEADKFLIENVAKHYELLDYIKYDDNDDKITKEYKFYENDNTKYIATTVEAVLGAIYQESKNFNDICKLVESWLNL